MLRKWITSAGFGSASVDTILADNRFFPGDILKGEVVIRGGNTDQDISKIELALVVQYNKGGKKVSHIFKKFPLSDAVMIEAEKKKRVPFQFRIPAEIPMSEGRYPIYLKTMLDVKLGVAPTDSDRIHIFPSPIIQKILREIEEAGFLLYKISNEYDAEVKPHPFYQMFQFKPIGSFHGYVDDFLVIFTYDEIGLHMEIEMIRTAKVLTSQLYWEHKNPESTLQMNGQAVPEDPLHKIRKMLGNRNRREK
ncbi:sporulation-control protein [Croceifilum oryzae]|uniref:Sporulation-control protein n=1 Tax=Croceifilum oryzae TaxID=1553429 RepID=A0AAJ1TQV6_9BACL|nr:sporulation protein [Croceifilum oryzae]MDQ0418831.1 sporulation-control protein [Croceifilum oryzae]